jgi:uncharacterized protein YqeY
VDDTSLRPQLRHALKTAMRSRDTAAVTALRSALAAIDNAEAISSDAPATHIGDGPIAGAVNGLGGSEAARRELTEPEIIELVAAQARERDDAADEYQRLGQHDAADRLRAEAAVLRQHLLR